MATNSNTSIEENNDYTATITADTGYTLTNATVSITMGGADITSTAYSNGNINISNVTGDIAINISAAQEGGSSGGMFQEMITPTWESGNISSTGADKEDTSSLRSSYITYDSNYDYKLCPTSEFYSPQAVKVDY